ncbi:hypothetical protein CUJ84_pRLN3000209 (plasmid) [Rhizobium leguminosarum]|uniref:Uncharacterized protein n=1 Tax=Rhizobium leguminosarum TaxID=384 RepID=A0A2K9ZGJ0_RHILE|nr:hypothetical protein CUJ84_pRLN3000209 [Rhizobium leguminosarum]
MHAFARTNGLVDQLGGELTLYWIEGYSGGVFLQALLLVSRHTAAADTSSTR